MADKNKFFDELDAMPLVTIGQKLAQHAFSKKERILIQEWIRQKPGRNYQTCIYHVLKSSRLVTLSEAAVLFQEGWSDAPRKYPPGLRGLWYRIVLSFRRKKLTLNTFWINHWKWIIGITIPTIISIIGLYLAWLQLKVPK